MLLSILIPTIEDRKEDFEKLYNRIKSLMFEGVEILYDNLPRYDLPNGISVGEKRQRLINRAKGKYLVFVDDDDNIEDNFFKLIKKHLNEDYDVITYKINAYIDGKKYLIDQSIYHENEQLKEGITKRYPSTQSIFKTEIAKRQKFTNINCGEDFKWTMSLDLKKEKKIYAALQVYNYDSKKTVASSSFKRAIVTFSNTEKYNAQVEIMKESIKKFAPDIDFIHYTNYEEIGCKPHSEYPYAFKPYSIHKANQQGYNQILWLDSPIHLIKSIDKIWQKLNVDKIILFDNIGFSIADYTHDICLAHFEINRTEAKEHPMVMACAMAFDFRDDSMRNVFDTYLGYAHTNAYQGEWSNHRHDQSVISCIAYKRNIKLLHPNSTFIAYDNHPGHLPHADSVCLISKSL